MNNEYNLNLFIYRLKRRLKGISFRNGLRPCFRDTKEEEPEDEIAYKDEEDDVENYEKLKNPVKETPKCKKPKNNKLGLFFKEYKNEENGYDVIIQ